MSTEQEELAAAVMAASPGTPTLTALKIGDALADLLAARDRRVRAEALREAAEAIDSGEVDHDDLRLAGVDEIATRGWSDGSVIDAYNSGSVWRDWLCCRADQIEADA